MVWLPIYFGINYWSTGHLLARLWRLRSPGCSPRDRLPGRRSWILLFAFFFEFFIKIEKIQLHRDFATCPLNKLHCRRWLVPQLLTRIQEASRKVSVRHWYLVAQMTYRGQRLILNSSWQSSSKILSNFTRACYLHYIVYFRSRLVQDSEVLQEQDWLMARCQLIWSVVDYRRRLASLAFLLHCFCHFLVRARPLSFSGTVFGTQAIVRRLGILVMLLLQNYLQ